MAEVEEYSSKTTTTSDDGSSTESYSQAAGDGPKTVAKSIKSQRRIKSFKNYKNQATKIPKKSLIIRRDLRSAEDRAASDETQLEKGLIEATNLVKTFRSRKSLSQMDIKRLRPVNQSSSSGRTLMAGEVPMSGGRSMINSEPHYKQPFKINDSFYYLANVVEPEMDAKMAGMRIFASIMLNAWRRRRDDVRHLTDEVNKLKKGTIKVKNQIHVLNSLFRIEQKQNDELNAKVKVMNDEQRHLQEVQNNLKGTVVELKTKNSLLEKDIANRDKENDGLNSVVTETRTQLFKAMGNARCLESSLAVEQRNNQQLENEKNELINQISKSKYEYYDMQARLEEQVSNKDEELNILKNQLKMKDHVIQDYEKIDVLQRKAIEELASQVTELEAKLQSTMMRKVKDIITTVPEKSLQYAHMFIFYLLPAVPPPEKIPEINLGKAMNYIWRH